MPGIHKQKREAVNSMNGKMIYGTRIGVSYVPYTATAATNTYTDNFLSSLGGEDIKASSRDNNCHLGKGSGDNNEAGSVFLQLKDLATSLGHKGHPVNIKDIDKHFSTITTSPVNRNASNNSEMNTSNNAVKAASSLTPSDQLEHDYRISSCKKERKEFSGFNLIDNHRQNDDVCIDKTDDKNEDNDGLLELKSIPEEKEEGEDDSKTGLATLLVKNLDESITDYKLDSLFNIYGKVVSAKVISNEFGESKGFGFVIMAEADDAVRAIKNLDGRIVVNRPIYISPTVQTRLQTK